MNKEENKTKGMPCNPDHNGECLVCDCWATDCGYQRYLNRDYKYESKEQLEHMFKDYITKEDADDNSKETLEEVALRLIPYKSTAGLMDSFSANMRVGFVKGAKWYQEQNKDKKYTIHDFLDMIQEFEEKELPNRNKPYHHEAEIAAGLKQFEIFIKDKQ